MPSNLLNKLCSTYKQGKVTLEEKAVEREKRRGKISKEIEYKVNDLVYFYNPSVIKGQTKKWAKHNEGPFVIKSFISPVTVIIQHCVRPEYRRIAHVENLSLVTMRDPTILINSEKNDDQIVGEKVQERIPGKMSENGFVPLYINQSEISPVFPVLFVPNSTPRYNLRMRPSGINYRV